MREIRINVSEDTYCFYEKIGRTMDSSAEEVMEMMLRVCVSRIKKKKKEKSDWLWKSQFPDSFQPYLPRKVE